MSQDVAGRRRMVRHLRTRGNIQAGKKDEQRTGQLSLVP